MLRRVILLVILLTMAGSLVAVPALAVPNDPRGVCFEVVGRDPGGLIHSVSFYRKPPAYRLEAYWLANGWSDVIVEPC